VLSLDILALLQLIDWKSFLGGLLGRKHSMTLNCNGSAFILNCSRAALTNSPMDFGLLFFKVGRGKEKQRELV